MSEYPEHDKLHAVKDESQAIGEFLDHIPWTLCEWRQEGDNGEPVYIWDPDNPTGMQNMARGETPDHWDYLNGYAKMNPFREEWEEGFYPINRSIEKVLADYFGIDLGKLEEEKQAMLAALRS